MIHTNWKHFYYRKWLKNWIPILVTIT